MEVTLRKVFVVPAGKGHLTNVYGMSNAIALTDSLGQHLNDRQMDFVVAHEVAHVKLKHGRKHLLVVVTIFTIAALSLFLFSLQTKNLHPLFQLLAIFGPLTARADSSIRQTAKRLNLLMPRKLAFRLCWNGDPRIAREEIAKHVGRITLWPVLRTYIATGVWDWLGVLGSAAAMVVPGARFGRYSHSIDFRIEIAA